MTLTSISNIITTQSHNLQSLTERLQEYIKQSTYKWQQFTLITT
jgi:hypothetical protein